jgi:hypothetical protein
LTPDLRFSKEKPPMEPQSTQPIGEKPNASHGAQCPAYNYLMDYWTLVRYRIPMWATCPRCHQSLTFEGASLLLIPLVLIGFSAGYKSDQIASALFGSRDLGLILLSIFIVVAPMHLPMAAYLRRRGKLKAIPPIGR